MVFLVSYVDAHFCHMRFIFVTCRFPALTREWLNCLGRFFRTNKALDTQMNNCEIIVLVISIRTYIEYEKQIIIITEHRYNSISCVRIINIYIYILLYMLRTLTNNKHAYDVVVYTSRYIISPRSKFRYIKVHYNRRAAMNRKWNFEFQPFKGTP